MALGTQDIGRTKYRSGRQYDNRLTSDLQAGGLSVGTYDVAHTECGTVLMLVRLSRRLNWRTETDVCYAVTCGPDVQTQRVLYTYSKLNQARGEFVSRTMPLLAA